MCGPASGLFDMLFDDARTSSLVGLVVSRQFGLVVSRQFGLVVSASVRSGPVVVSSVPGPASSAVRSGPVVVSSVTSSDHRCVCAAAAEGRAQVTPGQRCDAWLRGPSVSVLRAVGGGGWSLRAARRPEPKPSTRAVPVGSLETRPASARRLAARTVA